MRILMIVRQFHPWVGGTERQAQKLTSKLIDLGADVSVVTGRWAWGMKKKEVIGKIPVFRNFTVWGMFGLKGLRKFGGYIYILSLFWYLWKHRREYDLIHIHKLSYPAFPGVIAGRMLGKKIIIKIANSGQYSDIQRMKENYLLPFQRQMLPVTLKGDKYVATNSKIIDELLDAKVPLERIVIIPNGVEINGLHCKVDYGIDETATVAFVGRLHPQKGLDVLLRAFRIIIDKRQDIDWRLHILGDGPIRSKLQKLTEQFGMSHQVRFVGNIDNVSIQLIQADIFVLPSWAEGMSNALLEAMAHGLPCVASRIPGNIDLIHHGENGLLVTPGKETAFAEAIICLADDEMLRQKIGTSARYLVETVYSIDNVAKKYKDIYSSRLAP